MTNTFIDYKKYTYRYIRTAFIVISIIFIFLLSILYIIDPLQVFHKSFFYHNRLSPHMREQAAGIINNYTFDSIIIGTSMLENTSSGEASQKLGGVFVNISISGGDFYERAIILKYALKKGIRQVIYSLDTYYLDCRKGQPQYPPELWDFLYDDIILNDFRIYFTKKYLLTAGNPRTLTRPAALDRPNAWFCQYKNRFGGLENWIKDWQKEDMKNFLTKELPKSAILPSKKKTKKITNSYKKVEIEKYINKFIIDIISQYKSTIFHFIFPPYYKYRYATMLQNDPESFLLHQYAINYIVNRTHKMRNVYIYGFEDQPFTYEISNYKDTVHYNEDINSFFLDSIANKKYILTTHNVEQYLKTCYLQAYNFNIVKLNDEAQRMLKEIRTEK